MRFQFEWDERKAKSNIVKHGISFELAGTVFQDDRIVTIADVVHSIEEERWFSIGCASNGVMISIVYTWLDIGQQVTKIRLISARRATQTEIRYYQRGY
jgi:uncharacterized DUF497 family protein